MFDAMAKSVLSGFEAEVREVVDEVLAQARGEIQEVVDEVLAQTKVELLVRLQSLFQSADGRSAGQLHKLPADSGHRNEVASLPSRTDATQELRLEGAKALLVSHSMDSTDDDEGWLGLGSELSTQDCQKSSDASILQEYEGNWSLTQAEADAMNIQAELLEDVEAPCTPRRQEEPQEGVLTPEMANPVRPASARPAEQEDAAARVLQEAKAAERLAEVAIMSESMNGYVAEAYNEHELKLLVTGLPTQQSDDSSSQLNVVQQPQCQSDNLERSPPFDRGPHHPGSLSSPDDAPVWLYMYDLTEGVAARWSPWIFGSHIKGIWHTSIVVDWGARLVEYYLDGVPCCTQGAEKTAWGKVHEKRFLGYTSKTRLETCHFVKSCRQDFAEESYHLLWNNCNHFSDLMRRFLQDQSLPEDILLQHEVVLENRVIQLAARWLRIL
ncbi:Desi1 [Symbiodinium natans]|uniref:Desi1 protein n=1 Tax=Symbiodinium natans TaxID=878477 RepID=A0A812J3Y5_9DINO|nr:Desi1 [Symbiodinium natans]